MGGTPTVDYDALAKQYGGTTVKKTAAASAAAQKSPVDYTALARQYGGTSTPPPTPIDFTSNPKGEGLYRMGSYDFNQGNVTKPEIQVPYSRVKDALAAGYKLHPDEAPRYEKDSAHEGQGPSFRENVEQGLSWWEQPLPDVSVRPIDLKHPVTSALNRAGDAAQNMYQIPCGMFCRLPFAGFTDSLVFQHRQCRRCKGLGRATRKAFKTCTTFLLRESQRT